MTGVGDVFHMRATGVIATVLLHTGNAGAAGAHLCDGFSLDIAQATGIEEGGPAMVGRKIFLSGRGVKPDSMGQINSRLSGGE